MGSISGGSDGVPRTGAEAQPIPAPMTMKSWWACHTGCRGGENPYSSHRLLAYQAPPVRAASAAARPAKGM